MLKDGLTFRLPVKLAPTTLTEHGLEWLSYTRVIHGPIPWESDNHNALHHCWKQEGLDN